MNSPEARTFMETFGFDERDLQANRAGDLTERQQERVRVAQAQFRRGMVPRLPSSPEPC